MNGAKMKANLPPFRGLIVGYPKSGKTGAMVSLLEAGYKVRVVDFEGNTEPLINFASDRALANLDIVTLQDKLVKEKDDRYVHTDGPPEAYNRMMELMKRWTYKEPDGTVVDLGRPVEWGQDTVLVVDSLTAWAEAAFERAMAYASATPKYVPPAVYGAAVSDLTKALKAIAKKERNYHLIVLGHLRMLGPDDYLKMDEKDDKKHPELKPIREEKLEAIANDLLPVRLYPVATTKNQSPLIHKELPTMLWAEKTVIHGKEERIIRTRSSAPIDVGFPAPGAPEYVNVRDGMAKLFEIMGYKAPGFK